MKETRAVGRIAARIPQEMFQKTKKHEFLDREMRLELMQIFLIKPLLPPGSFFLAFANTYTPIRRRGHHPLQIYCSA